MTLLLNTLGGICTLVSEQTSETTFWVLVALGSMFFLWSCWRIVKAK